jgi:hypothetical protein
MTWGALWLIEPAFPQLNFGQISGAVTDSSGSVVPNAAVVITDVARGVSRALTTDSAGLYSAPSLVPGTYTVRVTAPGFNPIERRDVAVGVGQIIRIDLSLEPGTQNQTVLVEGTPPIINTTSAMISTTVEAKQINDLPLSGRLYTKLLDYTPGIAGRPGGNTPTSTSSPLPGRYLERRRAPTSSPYSRSTPSTKSTSSPIRELSLVGSKARWSTWD